MNEKEGLYPIMILCPECGKLAYFDSYFGVYKCSNCNWQDDTYHKNRVKRYIKNIEKLKRL